MTRPGPVPTSLAKARPLLSVAAPLLIAAVVLWQGVPAVVDAFKLPISADFAYLRDAGRVVESKYYPILYKGPGNYRAWREEIGYYFPGSYGYAPTVAIAFSLLPRYDIERAFDIWEGVIFVSIVALGVIVAACFKGWGWRVLAVSCVLCSEPLLLNLKISQTGATIAALTALGLIVYSMNETRGGAFLGLLILKPTALPVAVLALGSRPRLKPVLAFAGAAFLVGVTPFVWLGVRAFFDWIDVLWRRGRVEIADTTKYDQGILAPLGSHGILPILGVGFALLVAVGLTAFVRKRAGVHYALAFAALAQLLTNPHSLLYEWGVGFAVVMMLRRSGRPPFGSDLTGGLMLIVFFLVGQFAWQHKDANFPMEPLTFWALVMTGIVLAIAVSASQRPAVSSEASPEPSPQPALSPGS